MSDSDGTEYAPRRDSSSRRTPATVLPNTSQVLAAVLTPRQWDILELIAAGETNKSIAQIVGIGEDTVKKHVSTILKKLEVPNRAAAAFLYRDYIVSIPPV